MQHPTDTVEQAYLFASFVVEVEVWCHLGFKLYLEDRRVKSLVLLNPVVHEGCGRNSSKWPVAPARGGASTNFWCPCCRACLSFIRHTSSLQRGGPARIARLGPGALHAPYSEPRHHAPPVAPAVCKARVASALRRATGGAALGIPTTASGECEPAELPGCQPASQEQGAAGRALLATRPPLASLSGSGRATRILQCSTRYLARDQVHVDSH